MKFRLFVAAGNDAQTPMARPSAGKVVEKNRQESAARETELQTILDKFKVKDAPIGNSSSYGKVWEGNFGGKNVVIKTERIGSDSQEFEILKEIKQLRQVAPREIRPHLPVIYTLGAGKFWHYYVMENLDEVHQDVVADLFGGHYKIDSKDKDWENELSKDPTLANQNPEQISLIMDQDKWSDSALFRSAFSEWYHHHDRFYDMTEDEKSDFKRKIADAMFTAIQKITGSPTAKDMAHTVSNAVDAVLETSKEEWVWSNLEVALPELFLAIARAGFVARWHPQHSVELKYDKLKQAPKEAYHENLQRTLDWLSEKGIRWGDVHGKNIMMRPGTNDIVFIDFGLYSKAKLRFSLTKI